MPEDAQVPIELGALSELLAQKPEKLATGSEEVQLAALNATKYVFDLALKSEAESRRHILDLLSSLSPSQAPRTRSQTRAAAGPQAPTSSAPVPKLEQTPLASLYVDGMDHDQIWAQLDLRSKSVCEALEYALESTAEEDLGTELANMDLDGDDDGDGSASGLNGLEDEDEDEEDGEFGTSSEEDGESEEDTENGDEPEDEDGESASEELEEGTTELRDHIDQDDFGDATMDVDASPGPTLWDKIKPKLPASRKRKRGGHAELDDGFFDLQEFNAETEEAEAKRVSRGRLGEAEGDDEDSDEEAEFDLFAPVPEYDNVDADDHDAEETPDVFYRDFFDPPAPNGAVPKVRATGQSSSQQSGKVRFHDEVRVKQIKSRGKGLPVSLMRQLDAVDEDEEGEEEDDEHLNLEQALGKLDDGDDDGEEEEDEEEESSDEEVGFGERDMMRRLQDDLFADEEDDEDEEQDMTAHEKRMAALQEQIAELEAENVAKKDWTLMGEATARNRPQNSLLEEDLEFERATKAVPVVTEETVQALEDRIKARILDSNFDDVARRRPLDDKPFLPSRFLELQDTKSKQSLAEIYEDEYVAAQSGGVAGEDRDGKIRQEHEEIEKMWDGICYKLDALCNAHFTPKQPKASITTVTNVAAASLESALPTTRSAATMLAPEEVFAPASGDNRARSELTPVEKRARRNKEKKARKKARDQLSTGVKSFSKAGRVGDVKKQKEEALKSLVKSGKGVTVVGKEAKSASGKKRTSK